jgi:prepilin-type N-terminal cleavage/methylation domain-containing protein
MHGGRETAGGRWKAEDDCSTGNRPSVHHSSFITHRSAFTLVELLVTVTIILILASVALYALQAANESAKGDKTRATIAKINAIIMPMYESYLTRRLPIGQGDINSIINYNASVTNNGWSTSDPLSTPGTSSPRVTLYVLRDVMRMEMPDHWADVVDNTSSPSRPKGWLINEDAIKKSFTLPLASFSFPALAWRYYNAYVTAFNGYTGPKPFPIANGAAECLYQIVMSDPENASQFRSDEVGDTDNNGLKEFLDGWGNPIFFIRWPAGFVDYNNLSWHNSTDPSTALFTATNGNNALAPSGYVTPSGWGASPSDLQFGSPVSQPDPFDSFQVMRQLVERQLSGSSLPTVALNSVNYAIYPLIYSAGPDQSYSLNLGGGNFACSLTPSSKSVSGGDLNPFGTLSVSNDSFLGQPLDTGFFDNIHNHMTENR